MLKLSYRLLPLLAATLLCGCAATVTQTPAQSPTASTRAPTPAGTLVFAITGNSIAMENNDWSSFVEEWETSMSEAAAEAKMPIVLAKNEASLPTIKATLVRVTVNDFRYVTQVKRFMIGVFAGNASMDVDIEYIDLATNTHLGSKKFNTSSSASQGIFSAMTPKQVQAVSSQIVKGIATDRPAK